MVYFVICSYDVLCKGEDAFPVEVTKFYIEWLLKEMTWWWIYSFCNLGVGNQHHAQAALPPGTTRYPLYFRPVYVHKIRRVNYSSCDIIYNNTTTAFFHITNNSIIQLVVCFLLRNFPASEFHMPTFRNILSFPSSYTPNILKPIHPSYLPAYEVGTYRVFRNVGI